MRLKEKPVPEGVMPKAEIDYREALRTPRRYFGLAYVVFLGLAFALGVAYVSNLTAITKNAVVPAILPDSSGLVTDIPVQFPKNLPPVNVREISVPTPALIVRGKELFLANCASCHGTEGRGDGSGGGMLNPKPRNFHDLNGWTFGSRITQIYKTLENGVPKTGMASYNFLPPADRFALIHFIRSLATGQPNDTPQDLVTLDSTYQLSRGRVVAGQIPVRRALALVAREQTSRANAPLPHGPGEGVFSRVVSDPHRVVTALVDRHPPFASADELLQVVSPAPGNVGFRSSVNMLSRAEWEDLRLYLETVRNNAH
jgi:mono/diheme cytochrome c family protein